MDYPIKAQLASLIVVIVVVGGAFGAYYLNTSSVLAGQEQSISSLKSQVISLQQHPVSTTTVTTSVNTVLTSYTTTTNTVSSTVTTTVPTTMTTTTTYSPDKIVQILSVQANLTRIGGSSNYSLLFVVTWKNISNSTIYSLSACLQSVLESSILPTSTAKVAVIRGGGCQPAWSLVAMKPGGNTTSTDPKGGWDEKSYVVTSTGRVDASLTLLWATSSNPVTYSNMTFYYSFQV